MRDGVTRRSESEPKSVVEACRRGLSRAELGTYQFLNIFPSRVEIGLSFAQMFFIPRLFNDQPQQVRY